MQNDADTVREYLDRALVMIRAMKKVGEQSEKARRISVAVTQLEIACMCFNQSQFNTDHEYSPIIRK